MSADAALARLLDVTRKAARAKAPKKVLSDYMLTGTWRDDCELLQHVSVEVDAREAVTIIEAQAGCRAFADRMRQRLWPAGRPKPAQRSGMTVYGPDDVPPCLRDLLGEAAPGPVSHLRLPAGYELGPAGLTLRRGEDDAILVAPRPIYVSAIVRDIDSSEYHLDLSWRLPRGDWTTETVSREDVCNSRALIRLAKLGAPVDSGCAAMVVRYLVAFERCNEAALPEDWASRRMGWQGPKARHGFLWGSRSIGGRGTVRLLAEEGKREIADGFTSGGDMASWERHVWDQVKRHPRALLIMYASLAPCLLGILPGAPSFVVDIHGSSTGGKTTALQAAASVWGDPNRVIGSWSDTRAAIEHAGAFGTHLPLCLDDTKEAKDTPQKVIEVVYQVTGMRSKRRANPDGLRRTNTFSGVVLSTGEQAITAHGKDTGAAARVLPIQGFPFVGDDAGAVADLVKVSSMQHYGHAGPRVVEWLAANRGLWPGIVDNWQRLRVRFTERATEDLGPGRAAAFAGRAAPYVATIMVAAGLLEKVLGPSYAVCTSTVELLFRSAMAGARTAERHILAFESMINWLTSHQGMLHGAADVQRDVIARWNGEAPPDVIADRLRQWMEREGYQQDILADWHRAGFIVVKDGRRTVQVRFGSRKASCYRFTRKAMESLPRAVD